MVEASGLMVTATTESTAESKATDKAEGPRASTSYARQLQSLVTVARINFTAFILLVHPPDTGYVLGALHKYLASLVQGMIDGRMSKRITVSVPPQHGKSSLLTVLAAAWLVGRYPGIAIGLTGAVGSLLNDFSKRIRSIVTDPRYAWVFPGVVPVYGSNRADSWRLTNGSSIVARPAGSKLVGRRVDFLIIDDPHTGREAAESPLARARVLEWYFADCYTRLSPNAKVLIVATRWHPEDLIGHLTSEAYTDEMSRMGQTAETFTRIVLEARCIHPEADPLGRELGAPLCPELGRGESFLDATQAAIPFYEWESQYQGEPKPRQGDTAAVENMRYCEPDEVPEDVEWLRGWDLALTEKQASDFTAGAMCALHKATGDFYIGHMYHDKKAWTRLKPQIIALALTDADEYEARRMAVEVVGGFEIGYSELRTSELMGEVKVVKVISSKDKLVRAQPWLNKLEAKKMVLVRGKWNKAFVDELRSFPTGCFAAGTPITTARGEVPIERVVVGDHCLTRKGWRRVTRSWQTGVRKVITRFGLTATPDHRVWTQDGWKSLRDVGRRDRLTTCERQQLSMEKATTATRTTLPPLQRPSISDDRRGHEGRPKLFCCTGEYGSSTTEQSLTDAPSIMWTATPETTALKTWNASQQRSIMTAIECGGFVRVGLSLAPVARKGLGFALRATSGSVTSSDTPRALSLLRSSAACAPPPLSPYGAAPSSAKGIADILQPWKGSGFAVPVFDLTVEGEHEFFANGILVHNSHDDQVDGVSVSWAGLHKKTFVVV